MVSETEKPRLSISFSGGRSSAVMTKILLEKMANSHEIIVTFANTGCEHEGTLQFVHDCDRIWNFNTVWLEAVIGPEGVGPRAKVVTFETASRNGEPFEAAIAKHGIFNAAMPNCTGRLKVDVMRAYLRDHRGWPSGSYLTAIGIRADEIDRVSGARDSQKLIYPLINLGIGKKQVIAMMKTAPFDLQIPGEHYGNCVWCWKKTTRKLLTVAKHNPEAFDFPKRMEAEYGHVMPQRARKSEPRQLENRTFFRHNVSTLDILKQAQEGQFEEYRERTDQKQFPFWDESWDEELDVGGGCGDSCEIGADDDEYSSVG